MSRTAAVASTGVLNIADLRALAKGRLPRVVFDYLDGGAETETTMRENEAAFADLTFRPKCAVLTPVCNIATTVAGSRVELPVLLGPVGSTRMFYPRGEEAAARAANAARTIYTLSTLSGTRLEDVRAASDGPMWYQVYLIGGRDVATAMLERVKAAKFDALVVTIDTAVSGLRERDFRNGIKQLLARGPSSLKYLPQILSRPRWILDTIADGGLMKFPNVVLPTGPMEYADVGRALEESVVVWNDLAWIRELWKGPIIVKGIHVADDARRAVDEGADAVVVSNHGGRQLDGVAASLRALPEVVAAVGHQTQVLMDGGIRRGSDVVKALCLGARAVLIGRAYAYGLGAAGEAGASRALAILRDDLIRSMKLLGVSNLAGLDRSYLESTAAWFNRP